MPAIGQNRSRDFGLSVTNRQDRVVMNVNLCSWFNLWIYESKWAFTPAKVVIYQSEHLSDLAGFDARSEIFPRRLLNKFEVWVSCEALCDIFYRFFVWFYKMEFNTLPDLLNTGFIIIKIGLFYYGVHFGAKMCGFLTFLTQNIDLWSVLIRGRRPVKTLQILVELF